MLCDYHQASTELLCDYATITASRLLMKSDFICCDDLVVVFFPHVHHFWLIGISSVILLTTTCFIRAFCNSAVGSCLYCSFYIVINITIDILTLIIFMLPANVVGWLLSVFPDHFWMFWIAQDPACTLVQLHCWLPFTPTITTICFHLLIPLF